jgi:transcriptional regulator with XRE-family HTH domain
MGGEPGPYTAARRLCLTLRRARESVALTQAQVAERLSWSTSKVARIESGDVGIGLPDLRSLCAIYDLGPAVIEELNRLAQAAKRRGWWHEFRDVFPEQTVMLFAMEMEANRLRIWSPNVVPGLLQTEAYAEAVIMGLNEHFSESEATARRRLTARLRRQDVVFGRPDPPELIVSLDESVLYRRVGGRDTMVEQIRRLVECTRRPNVTLRIRPFESSIAPASEFMLVDFDAGDTVVYGEDFASVFRRDDDAAGRTFDDLFSMLRRTSLDAARTGQLLHRVAVQYERGRQVRPWLLE